MPLWLETILEIIKITVPALIVFFTVLYLFREYLDGQVRLKTLELKQKFTGTTLPLKLQAYERLTLLCERIALSNLILRVRKEGMDASTFRLAMMMNIQQEYEHNISQQVYVSEDLWKIITFAKSDAINTINQVAQTLPKDASAADLSQSLFKYLNEIKATTADKARLAIAQEARTFL